LLYDWLLGMISSGGGAPDAFQLSDLIGFLRDDSARLGALTAFADQHNNQCSDRIAASGWALASPIRCSLRTQYYSFALSRLSSTFCFLLLTPRRFLLVGHLTPDLGSYRNVGVESFYRGYGPQ